MDKLIGLLWNMARPPEKPLWWCLREEEKARFRAEIDALPDPSDRPDLDKLERELRHA